MTNLIKTRVLSIDAWRDYDGWTWDNWFTIEEGVYLPEGITNRALIKFARDNMGLLNEKSKGRVTVDDDGYNLVIIDKNTKEPLFAFCYGEYLN